MEKWEAKRQQKNQLKALKKARASTFSITDDEKHHEMLHRRAGNKYGMPDTVTINGVFFFLLRVKPVVTIKSIYLPLF